MTQLLEAAFHFDSQLDAKSASVTETEDGDLLVEGWVADYDPDRDDELFEPGSLDLGLKAYMESNPVLLYNHRFGPFNALALGQTLSVAKKPNPANGNKEGIFFKARVDYAEPGTEARDVYNKVKRGTIRGVSFGGKFHRRFKQGMSRVWKADIMEFSLTPVPANPRSLAGVATKAFSGEPIGTDPVLDAINASLDSFGRGLDSLSGQLL